MKKFLPLLLVLLFVFSCSTNEPTKTVAVNQPPGKVELSLPQNGAQLNSDVLFIWKAANDPEGSPVTYSLYLGTSPDNMEAKIQNTMDTTAKLELSKGTYYWKLVASDPQGVTSESETWSFSVNNPPIAPELISPASGSLNLGDPVTLKWLATYDPDDDPLTYTLLVGESPSDLKEVTTTTSTSYTLKDLEGHTLYYWQVVASDGELSTPSEIGVFSVNHTPENLTLISPSADAQLLTLPIELKWNVEDPDNDPVTCNLYFGSTTDSLRLLNTSLTYQYLLTRATEQGDWFYWQVSCTDNYGTLITSPVERFTINFPPTTPGLLEPDDNATGIYYDGTFYWKAATDVNLQPLTYSFYITEADKDFSNPFDLNITYNSSEDSYTATVENLKANTTYKWKVVVSDGTYSTSSQTWKFTTQAHHFIQVSRGGFFTCALEQRMDLADKYPGAGDIWCWGQNYFGQIGNGRTGKMVIPPYRVKNPDGTLWRSVSAGSEHVCAIDVNDKVWCWGRNNWHQISSSNQSYFATPYYVTSVQVEEFPQPGKVSAGNGYTCIEQDGEVYCRGWNAYGQVGNGSNDNVVTNFAAVPGLFEAQQISAGGWFACAILTNGQLYCWGQNAHGELGIGSVGGIYRTPQEVHNPAGANWKYVSAGGYHTCAIDDDGNLWCWGYNIYGELGKEGIYITGSPQLVEHPLGLSWKNVKTGLYHTCAIDDTNRVYCWGWNIFGELGDSSNQTHKKPSLVASLNDPGAKYLSPGSTQRGMCAVTTDNALYCWGNNSYGETNAVSTGQKPFPVQVKSDSDWWPSVVLGAEEDNGYYTFTCANNSNGAFCWGSNIWGALAHPQIISTNTPLPITSVTYKGSFSLGWSGGTVCYNNYKLFCWGRNEHGQVGRGDTISPVYDPYPVTSTVLMSTTGFAHTCFISYDRDPSNWKLYCMGSNGDGQLGDGTQIDRHIPVHITLRTPQGEIDLPQIVVAGQYHTCAISQTGRLYCWGWNKYGQVGVGAVYGDAVTQITYVLNPTIVTNPTGARWNYVSPGKVHTCAIDETGKMYCWGYSGGYVLGEGNYTYGQNVYSPIPVNEDFQFKVYDLRDISMGVVPLATGNLHTCAIASNDNLYCWGNNYFWQLGVNPNLGGTGIPTRVPLPDGEIPASIHAGKNHTCVTTKIEIDSDIHYHLYCWGGETAQVGFLGQPDEFYSIPYKIDW